jgi:hypothetical protein
MSAQMIFVFGSNRAGIHGAGAAKYAHEHCGAVWGIGEGLSGDAYALPTCDHEIRPLKLAQIRFHVDRFLSFAKHHPTLQFQVTRVGCGLAGFTDDQIAPLFLNAPDNVWLPSAFYRAVSERRAAQQPHIPEPNPRSE